MMKDQRRPLLNIEKMFCSDETEKTPCVHVSGNENMLAVINDISGNGIAERVCASACKQLLFKQCYGNIAGGEHNRGRKPAQPAADNNDSLIRIQLRDVRRSGILQLVA